eukprot:TRINITY_DN62523_c0_g1_i1.p1 TRINITY_DN62523_c0_g1~~TRINITY_DN62523_c0_g1_i1.p1  ORF type:complete len:1304 (+),score=207.16 TRINITY_DN62523_c0_g1_i1:34-3945(+)
MDSSAQRGLCGPSELRTTRLRKESFSLPDVSLPFDIDAGVSAVERIAGLRRSILGQVLERAGLVAQCGGRTDIAALVQAFLEDGSSTLEHRDFRMTSTGNRGKRKGTAYASSRSRNVDFFFKAVSKVTTSLEGTRKLQELLEDAWQEDPEVCLKLIFHLGAARKGKQDRWNFYDAMLWLWEKSPATVLLNLERVEPTVYWKSLLEILARICEGWRLAFERDVVMERAYQADRPRLLAQDVSTPPPDVDAPGWRYMYSDSEYAMNCGLRVACGEWVTVPPEDADGWVIGLVDNGQNSANRKRGDCGWQPRTRLEQAENAVRKYDSDPLYRALHLKVASLFAKQLAADESNMQAGKRASLASKWAPLLDKSYDRRTLVAESIARMLYPASLPEFADLSEQHYSYRARLKYAALLSRLKEHRKEPARLMSANRWEEIEYKKVPATCMKLCAPLFQMHDGTRFEAFLEAMKNRKGGKLNAGSSQPHELMRLAITGEAVQAGVAELQWKSLVEDVKKGSKFRCCLAVCDFSSSMFEAAAMGEVNSKATSRQPRIPPRTVVSACKDGVKTYTHPAVEPPPRRGPLRCMDIAWALSLLISEVADEPFRNKVIALADCVDVAQVNAGMTMTGRFSMLNRTRSLLLDKQVSEFEKRFPSHAIVRGATGDLMRCNGEYTRNRVLSNGRASYKQQCGALLAFNQTLGVWQMTLRGQASFTCHSNSMTLPQGTWTTDDGRTCSVSLHQRIDHHSYQHAPLFKVFEALLEMREPPEKIFIFSAMAFSQASEVDGRARGVYRDSAGQKLPVFAAAEELYRRAGKQLPEVVFWNLSHCERGVPVVATQQGAVLVSGFSAALVKDLLAHGTIDPLALISQVISAPLFAPLKLPSAADDSVNDPEQVIRDCLALEGFDARCPEAAPAKHSFAPGKEWEVVETTEVEQEAVEKAAPRRQPLLAVRAVRRIKNLGDADATEDGLLAMIGRFGTNIKEARAVLSMAVARRLQMRARVWLDVEHVEQRLGALAVTVSARAPEALLTQEMRDLLLPACDGLLARLIRAPDVAAKRKLAWESGEWLAWDESKRSAQPFLGETQVVPALLAGLQGEPGVAVAAAAKLRRRRFPVPRIVSTPLPRLSAAQKAAQSKQAALARSIERIRRKQWIEHRIARWSREEVSEQAEWAVNTQLDLQVKQKLKQKPRGGKRNRPALSSRRVAPYYAAERNRQFGPGRNAQSRSLSQGAGVSKGVLPADGLLAVPQQKRLTARSASPAPQAEQSEFGSNRDTWVDSQKVPLSFGQARRLRQISRARNRDEKLQQAL